MSTRGEAFAQAMATKDAAAVRGLTTRKLDFKALTPGRFWEATTQDDLVAILFGRWLEPSDEVVALLSTTTDEVAGRQHVAYRLHLRNGTGDSLMEQQMYYEEVGDRITYARILCSGFVPLR